MATPRALYIRPLDAVRKPHPDLHLERLLWSYNNSLAVEWIVSYGWPEIAPAEPGAESYFAFTFVDEDAVPNVLKAQGITRGMLRSDVVVWVSRAVNPSPAVPILDSCVVLERPLSYDRFCQTCVKVLSAGLEPFAGRFEYHTFDVLQDIWSEAEAVAPERDAPPPLAEYSLDNALDPSRREGIVVTRRMPSFTLLYANRAFWDKVGWPNNSRIGHNLSFLQGPLTQADVVAQLHARLASEAMRDRSVGDWRGTLLNYTKNRHTFQNKLHVTPCTDAALYVGRVSINDEPDAVPEAAPMEPQLEVGQPHRTEVDHGFAEALADVLLDTAENVVVTKAESPFTIVHVNDAWCELCGFDPRNVIGKTLKTIQGPQTDTAFIAQSMASLVQTGEPVEMHLTNYKAGGDPFHNRVSVEPLRDSSGTVRYFVGRLHEEAGPVPMAAEG